MTWCMLHLPFVLKTKKIKKNCENSGWKKNRIEKFGGPSWRPQISKICEEYHDKHCPLLVENAHDLSNSLKLTAKQGTSTQHASTKVSLTWPRRHRNSRCGRSAGPQCLKALRGQRSTPGRRRAPHTTGSFQWRETSDGCSLQVREG